MGWFFTYVPQCYLGYFWYWYFTAVVASIFLCSIYLKPLQLLIFMFCYIMPFVDYIKYWKLISLNSYCHKLESQWNKPGYVYISFCIHRQLIQSLSVTGTCLDMSRLVVAKQKAHRQTDTGSKVILFYISNIKVILFLIYFKHFIQIKSHIYIIKCYISSSNITDKLTIF
jgi:hypothetical protein